MVSDIIFLLCVVYVNMLLYLLVTIISTKHIDFKPLLNTPGFFLISTSFTPLFTFHNKL